MTPPRTYIRRGSAADRLAALVEHLVAVDLPARPACAGGAPRSDLHVDGETDQQRDTRHQHAVTVCRTACPALAACTALLPALPHDTSGVWAGAVRLGIPRKHR